LKKYLVNNTYKNSKDKLKKMFGGKMINVPINDEKQENETINTEENQEVKTAEQNYEVNAEEYADLLIQVDKLTKERDDFKDQLQRKVAEFENFRTRTLKEKAALLEYGNSKILEKFLVLLDTFEKAIEAGKKSQDYDSLLKGIELLHQQAIKIFEEAGVTEMADQVGEDFNIDFHDALMIMPSDLESGKVALVMQKGYMYKDNVLRHASVATSAEKE
jgi:molecular chaperone GrpE